MAKNKIQRIDQEIARVREKIAEYQEKLKTLEAQKTEAENLEIVQMARALRLTPEQLNAMLSGGVVPWYGRCLCRLRRTGGDRP